LKQTSSDGNLESVRQVKDYCDMLGEAHSTNDNPGASATNMLHEYYCNGNEIASESFNCPNGCVDGACVIGAEPYCTAIGSKSEGWYENGERIIWDNCDGCYAKCKYYETDSEGWYSSCDNKLIKYANCGEDQEEPLITVTSPDGGETWTIGGTYDITWTCPSGAGVDMVDIFLKDKRVGAEEQIGNLIDCSIEKYSWKIGDISPGENFFKIQLRHIAGGQPLIDESDDYFSIVSVTACSSLQNQTSCLDNSNCYWDQQYDNCGTYDSSKQTCSDPDNGKDFYTQAHTYGFRESYADERDKRIRTGGRDACIGDKLREHYCANDYYIRTYDVECSNGCANGACVKIPSSVEIISPNGGEQWALENSYYIIWKSEGVKEFTIYLVGNSRVREIGSHVSADLGKYFYSPSSVANINPSNYKIRMTAYQLEEGYSYSSDESDDYFNIVKNFADIDITDKFDCVSNGYYWGPDGCHTGNE
jgi:hypothetical protein